MRNPRSFSLDEAVFLEAGLSTDEPRVGGIVNKMWDAGGSELCEDAYNTPFVQGIKIGLLDPVAYGGFCVSDAYYCFNGADDYGIAAEKAANSTMKMFLLAKESSYREYNTEFHTRWRIGDISGVDPLPICREYSTWETTIAQKELPIYTLAAMLGCEWLWKWLGQYMAAYTKNNIYGFWITDNAAGATSATALANFIDQFQKEAPYDENKAIALCLTAMTYEVKNFTSAEAPV